MTFKTLTVALALALPPVLSFAEGCGHDRQALSCAEGTVFDDASGTCVSAVNS